MMDMFVDVLHKFSFSGLIVLFLFQAIVLFLKGRNNRVRKTMGCLVLIWVMVYVLAFIGLHINRPVFDSLYRVHMMVVGNVFISLMYLFPMQILLPSDVSFKKALVVFLPVFLIPATYYLTLPLLGESVEEIRSYADLWHSIGHFNVWFRFVILFCGFLYMIFILRWLYRFEKDYIQWKDNNYSDQESVDISWMRQYDVLMIMIFLCYLLICALGGQWTIILHTYVVMYSISYISYRAYVYESPYPELNVSEENVREVENEIPVLLGNSSIIELSDASFSKKIGHYKEIFSQWMEEEKPYLYHDFKLTDVSRILPLNRTYLSKIFNDGFGKNFSEVVRVYRLEYSKELLVRNPHLPLHKVAEMSGFSSDSTYNRAFKKVYGITPKQFKLEACLRE